jgi:microcystin-dependent protein
MAILFANNVNMQLAADLAADDTSFSVIAGQGSQCPEIATDSTDYMLLKIRNKNGLDEIVKIIEHELDSDTFIIGDSTEVPHTPSTDGRAYEKTFGGYQTALAITASDAHKITMPVTAATLEAALVVYGSGTTTDDFKKLHSAYLSRNLEFGFAPVGSIVAYVPGYFTDGSNAGFTHQMVSANTVAAVNALLNSSGWYVCDGAALYDADSGIFNGVGRYLPNLTNDRFLMGDTNAGTTGGANITSISHTHTTGDHTLLTSEMPEHSHSVALANAGAHTHTFSSYAHPDGSYNGPYYYTSVSVAYALTTASAGLHTHTATCATAGNTQPHNHGSTGSAGSTAFENRPLYLSCFYIMRIK